MDITRNMPKDINVEDPNGRVFTHVIEYEWTPTYCPTCLIIGQRCQPKEDAVARPKIRQGEQKYEWHHKRGQRYLGVPLSTKRVSILQYQPLIDKIMERILNWTSRFLSYAGRTQLN